MRRLTLFMVMVVFLGGCFGPVKRDHDMLHDICWANDLFGIYEHDRLFFTFNAQLPDKVVQREWEWHIKTNRVFMNGSEQGESKAFVNDVYWLLFPLKAYQDRDQIVLSVREHQISPLLQLDSTEVVIRYVSGKGFTPNDTYKLYVDDSMTIREWSYLKAGKEPPARMTAWKDYQTIGNMKLSLMREGPDGFKVWFTGVRVE